MGDGGTFTGSRGGTAGASGQSAGDPNYDLFISYARDGATVEIAGRRRNILDPLKRELERHRHPDSHKRFRVCTDDEDFRIGGPVDTEIRKRLGDAGSLLVLSDDESANSDWVAKEIEWFGKARPRMGATVTKLPAEAFPGVFDAGTLQADLSPHKMTTWKEYVGVLRKESHKIVSLAWGVDVQRVHDRFRRDDRRRRRLVGLGVVSAASIVGLVAGEASWQVRRTAAEDKNVLLQTLADQSTDPTRRAVLLREVRRPLSRGWDRAVEVVSREVLSESVADHPARIDTVAFSSDGRHLATGSEDGVARLWNADDPWQPLQLTGHRKPVKAVAFSRTGDRLMTASDDRVQVWTADGAGSALMSFGSGAAFSAVALSEDGTRVAAGASDHTVTVWTADGHTLSLSQMRDASGHTPITAIAFNHGASKIVVGDGVGGAWVWTVDNAAPLVALRGHSMAVFGVAFAPDSNTVVTASVDATARVWKAIDGRELVTFPHDGPVLRVAFSPDGTKIVTGSSDATARVWDATGSKPGPIAHAYHTMSVEALAFSPDSAWVASGSEDHTLFLWTANGSGPYISLKGHDNRISSMAFSPDGKRIVTGSWDNTARVWPTAVDQPPVSPGDGEAGASGSRRLVSRLDARTMLWRATIYCLPANERVRLLAERSDEATAGLSRCRELVAKCRSTVPNCRRAVEAVYGSDAQDGS